MIVSGWTIRRGRSYELDKNSPGTASVTLIDTTGELNPGGGAYAFTPGTPGAIALDGSVVFRGNVARLAYDPYPTEDYAIATLEMVDGLDRLAKTEMYAGVGQILEWGDLAFLSGAQDGDVWFDQDDQTAAVGHRIRKLLDQAEWPAGLREVFSGNVGLQETVYAYRTPCLSAILDCADAEFPGIANFYVQKTGEPTFHGRFARFTPGDAQYHISTWLCGDQAAVNSNPARALVFGLDYDIDEAKIINSVISTPREIADADINGQRYENAASIAAYGSHSLSFDNLLTLVGPNGETAKVETKKFGQFWVDNFKDPRVRVNRIRFRSLPTGHANADELMALMKGIDISDIISLSSALISGTYYVEGLSYTATASGGAAMTDVALELDVSPTTYYGSSPF